MASMSTLASPLAPTSPRVGDRAERATSSRCRVRGVAPRRVDARAHARVAPDPRSAVAACVIRGPATRGVGDAPAPSAARRGVVAPWDGVAAVPTPRRRRGGRRPIAAASAAGAFDAETAVSERPAVGASKYRFAVVSLVALALLLCNADRVIMSVAGVPLAAQNGWGAETLGLVQSSFLWGYTLTPFLGGVLADKIGGKNVLLAGIATWSIATALTPFAAAASLPALLACRAVMGLGEGVALPCMNNITARWVPRRERSRAVAACMAGFQSGSVVGLLAAPVMLRAGGVSRPFLVFGVAGVVWAAVWAAAATAFPRGAADKSGRVNAEELRLIEEGGAVVEGTGAAAADFSGDAPEEKRVSLARLLSAPPVLACVFANFVNNWGYFILLAWMPLYFKQALGLDLARSAQFSALPWLAMAVCGAFAGAFADWLINDKGVSVTATRKITQGVGFVGPALGLLSLTFSTTAPQALAALTFAVGCTAFTQAGFLVNFQEIGPRYVGAMHGAANTAGSLAGIVGTYGAGVVLEATGSWNAVLRVTAGVYLAGAAVWLAFSTGERVFD
jgi:ACS family sodium-dependent inorganic phosphate cotransporter